MLKELQIKNFAIIDDITVKFSSGLNILSGETGAGKTLIIEAINMLLGERANSELIRDGEDRLIVQGYFDLSSSRKSINFLVSENLADTDDDFNEVIITREVNRQGKNRSFINGIFTQVSTLKSLGKCFLDLHGQHDHQYLLDWQTHIDIIDSFGKEAVFKCLDSYKTVFEEYMNIIKNLNSLLKLQREKETKLTDLQYKVAEIEKLKLDEDEEYELEEQKNVLRNYEKVFNLCSGSTNLLNGNENMSNSLLDNFSQLQKNLQELSDIDKRFEKFSLEILNIYSMVNELNIFLSEYLGKLEFSSEKLDLIQERLFAISEIKRKYNMSIEQIKDYAVKMKKEIENMENLDEEIESKKQKFKALKERLTANAADLSACRQKVIEKFIDSVKRELKDLSFQSVLFDVKNELNIDDGSTFNITVDGAKVKPRINGIDNIEFLISLNTGESAKPLSKIVSGGEVSRVMLSLKSILSGIDNISTMVFDEIDTGIGGSTSIVVGRKLYGISRRCQVICITHLAQIAAFADSHYFIDKVIQSGRTKINISLLSHEKSRVKEIARMLSGMTENEISIRHAVELLNEINKIRNGLNYETGEELKIGN